MPSSSRPPLLAVALAAAVSSPAQTVRSDGSLPGYYEFFAKRGEQEVIVTERVRDRAIAKGKLAPRAMATPLPDLELPGLDGRRVKLRSIAPGRNLVVVAYRAWW